MKLLIKISQAVIVEGKYDKIRLSNILDATIITTEGFKVFKDDEKKSLIKLMAEKKGIVIITDSDHAGQMIRKYVEKIAQGGKITNVYLPQIVGKESRKAKPGAEGVLGVEGTDDAVILAAIERSGLTGDICEKQGRQVTKTDLYNLGVSGTQNSADKRRSLCLFLGLPSFLTANSLLEFINSLYGYDDFLCEVEKWKVEAAEN